MYEIKCVDTLDELIKLEELKNRVLDIHYPVYPEDNYFIIRCLDKRELAYAIYRNDIMIAGIYITNRDNSIYIDYLFVDKKYQRCCLGTELLNYILSKRKEIEQFFNRSFYKSMLLAKNEDAKKLYLKMGYKGDLNPRNVPDEMVKYI